MSEYGVLDPHAFDESTVGAGFVLQQDADPTARRYAVSSANSKHRHPINGRKEDPCTNWCGISYIFGQFSSVPQ
ncbi:MAG TPA: hypothetical protein VLG47_04500 [Candidatus Saccharimonadales bacterium]|nr:hypothetical protein [Candidatus Saccharimonadales bacterium]